MHVAETAGEDHGQVAPIVDSQSEKDSEEEAADSEDGSSTSESSAHVWSSEVGSEETATDEETFYDAEEKIMRKGGRRHVREGLKDVMQCMLAEAKAKHVRPKQQ